MKIQQFLEHHGIVANPFAEEDAQADPVFRDHCIASTYHPTWDKIYGDPAQPSTSIVFGEKVTVARDATPAELEEARVEVTRSLDRAHARAYELAGGKPWRVRNG